MIRRRVRGKPLFMYNLLGARTARLHAAIPLSQEIVGTTVPVSQVRKVRLRETMPVAQNRSVWVCQGSSTNATGWAVCTAEVNASWFWGLDVQGWSRWGPSSPLVDWDFFLCPLCVETPGVSSSSYKATSCLD